MINLYNTLFINAMKYLYILKDVEGITATGGGGNGGGHAGDICNNIKTVLRLVGYVILGIKIVVPILLVVIGMIELTKSISDANSVADATKKLVQKAIIAVLVFLVATAVGLIMTLLNGEDYKECTMCINRPWECHADYMNLPQKG